MACTRALYILVYLTINFILIIQHFFVKTHSRSKVHNAVRQQIDLNYLYIHRRYYLRNMIFLIHCIEPVYHRRNFFSYMLRKIAIMSNYLYTQLPAFIHLLLFFIYNGRIMFVFAILNLLRWISRVYVVK